MWKTFKRLRMEHKTIFAIVVAFAVILFWRGAWGLMDYYFDLLFPDGYVTGLWLSVVLGLVVLWATHYVSKALI